VAAGGTFPQSAGQAVVPKALACSPCVGMNLELCHDLGLGRQHLHTLIQLPYLMATLLPSQGSSRPQKPHQAALEVLPAREAELTRPALPLPLPTSLLGGGERS
jgi:hypothetical protein